MGSMTLLGCGKPPAASSDAAETTAFLARTSGLSGPETAAYKTLINGLVADGLFTGVLDALYILATKDEATAKLNLVQNAYNPTKDGTITFTADTGAAGNGSDGALRTGFTPSTAGGNFTLNSCSIGAYIRTSRTDGSVFCSIGAQDAATSKVSWLIPQGTNTYYDLNEAGLANPATSNAQGSWCTSRTASNLTSLYKNASSTAVATTAQASVGLTDNQISVCATTNSGGGTSFHSTDQIAAAFIGRGLTGAEYLTLSNRINAYMTALGVNVY